jgi:N-acetylneuraminic acid mutarotase
MTLAAISIGLQAQSDPRTVGQWSSVQTWPYRAVHTHLLPNGKVLSWSQFTEGDKTQIFDPSTNSVATSTIAPFNTFCAGHAFLPDGRLLVAGGHIADGVGLQHAAIFDFRNNSWSTLPDMNAGRWYPTNTTLANGDILVLGGTIDSASGNDKLPQIWQQST